MQNEILSEFSTFTGYKLFSAMADLYLKLD